MARRRAHRPQRRRIFVGCEGASEVGYVALIRLLAEEAGFFVHLDIRDCCGGDPLAIIETAVREHESRKARHGAYVARSIFLDATGAAIIREGRLVPFDWRGTTGSMQSGPDRCWKHCYFDTFRDLCACNPLRQNWLLKRCRVAGRSIAKAWQPRNCVKGWTALQSRELPTQNLSCADFWIQLIPACFEHCDKKNDRWTRERRQQPT